MAIRQIQAFRWVEMYQKFTYADCNNNSDVMNQSQIIVKWINKESKPMTIRATVTAYVKLTIDNKMT